MAEILAIKRGAVARPADGRRPGPLAVLDLTPLAARGIAEGGRVMRVGVAALLIGIAIFAAEVRAAQVLEWPWPWLVVLGDFAVVAAGAGVLARRAFPARREALRRASTRRWLEMQRSLLRGGDPLEARVAAVGGPERARSKRT